MTQVKGGAVDALLARPDPALRAVLLYGPDAGLARERARILLKRTVEQPDDPFRVTDLGYEKVLQDPALLADEVRALSMLGGRRAVMLRTGHVTVAPAHARILPDLLEPILDDGAWGDTLLIVEAGDLKADNRLRKLFEGARKAVAVPCYGDGAADVAGLARGILDAAGLRIDPDAMSWLAEHLGGDRMVTRGELEKLALYKGRDGGTVTLDDVLAAVGDSSPANLDDLAYATAGGDRSAVDEGLQRCLADGEHPVRILGVVLRHFQKLHAASVQVKRGRDPAQVARSNRIFFKHQPAFQAQITQWTPDRLARALDLLLQADIECKTTGYPAEAVCGRALLRVAQAAPGGRRVSRRPGGRPSAGG